MQTSSYVRAKDVSCGVLHHLHHKPTKLSQTSHSLTTSAAVLLEMASFSLKTGTTFMLSKSSVVADRFLRKSASAKSLLVTRIWAAWQSIRPKRESYRAMSPLCPAAAAARPAPHQRLTHLHLCLSRTCVSVALVSQSHLCLFCMELQMQMHVSWSTASVTDGKAYFC